jgi:gluconolactonase
MDDKSYSWKRRILLKSAGGAGLLGASKIGLAQTLLAPHRYPEPAVQILDPSFARYRGVGPSIEHLASGMQWAEGPVYFPDSAGGPGYLLVSDIPNNRIMKFDEADGSFTVWKKGVNYVNGNTRDRQGRLVSCEHSVTRRVVRWERDGQMTIIADKFNGKRFNSPNDIVVKSDDTIWFTDPPFGLDDFQGVSAPSEQPTTNVYRVDRDGSIRAVITDLTNPNGLAFSPDEKKLYVVARENTTRGFWMYDVAPDNTLSNKTLFIDAGNGSPDGFRVDRDGNLWCGWGVNFLLQSQPTDVDGRKVYQLDGKPEELDGVMVFNQKGKPIAFIKMPERCANLEFGGPKRNRLYMACGHSLYAMYVGTRAAV